MKETELASKVLESNKLLTLATSTPDGNPWVSVVGYQIQEGKLYWMSTRNTYHSRILEANTRTAIAVVGQGGAVYARGEVNQIPHDKAVQTNMEFNLTHLSEDDKGLALYEFVPGAMWYLYPEGQGPYGRHKVDLTRIYSHKK